MMSELEYWRLDPSLGS